jgi:hypothetical protein
MCSTTRQIGTLTHLFEVLSAANTFVNVSKNVLHRLGMCFHVVAFEGAQNWERPSHITFICVEVKAVGLKWFDMAMAIVERACCGRTVGTDKLPNMSQ